MRVLIAIPVFNEEALLADSVSKLQKFLHKEHGFEYQIVIADNGSTDGTLRIANALSERFSEVRVSHLDLKGRGRALKKAWTESSADILCYMDADLSTDLQALPRLVEGLASGKFAVGTGSRLLNPRGTTRSLRREVCSRGYNLLVKMILGTRFSDAQCGFKGLTRDAARVLLPLVDDPGWFFDTELLAIAEKLGFPILDLSVTWVEDQRRASKVNILRTAIEDLRGLRRLRRKLAGLTRANPEVSSEVRSVDNIPG